MSLVGVFAWMIHKSGAESGGVHSRPHLTRRVCDSADGHIDEARRMVNTTIEGSALQLLVDTSRAWAHSTHDNEKAEDDLLDAVARIEEIIEHERIEERPDAPY